MIDRRHFVRTAFAALLVSAVDVPWLYAKRKVKLKGKKFRRSIDRSFQLQGDHWHLVELARVHEITSNAELEQFSLVFRGSIGDDIAEGIYRVKPPRGPSFEAAIHPAGEEHGFKYYISHFSLIQPKLARRLKREARLARRKG